MAVELLPSVGFSLTLPNATTLVPADDPAFGAGAKSVPDNCATIIIYNTDAANRVMFRFAESVSATAGNTTVANSTILPASASITLAIPQYGHRSRLGLTEGYNLFLKAEGGTPIVNITYTMSNRYPA